MSLAMAFYSITAWLESKPFVVILICRRLRLVWKTPRSDNQMENINANTLKYGYFMFISPFSCCSKVNWNHVVLVMKHQNKAIQSTARIFSFIPRRFQADYALYLCQWKTHFPAIHPIWISWTEHIICWFYS